MINLDNINLDKLEQIASGGFGVVYRDGPKAIKIYRGSVKTLDGSLSVNPSLILNKRKLSRLLKRNEKIKNTDLIEDIVCLNNKCVGVVYPYYDGITLNECMDYPIESKIDMSRQIIENAKELTDNKIYPLDYKLNNMIYIDDKVKIIDLDDYYTKVKLFKSDRLLKRSNIILDETIKSFMGEYEFYSYIDSDLQKLLLKRKSKLNDSFEDISRYVDEKEKPINFLLVDLDTDISKIQNIDDYLLLFVSDFVKNEDIVSYIINNNINVYDVVRSNKLLKYLNNHSIDECVDKTGVKILKKIK